MSKDINSKENVVFSRKGRKGEIVRDQIKAKSKGKSIHQVAGMCCDRIGLKYVTCIKKKWSEL